MVCDCGSVDISTQMDVGCDIDPSGEERQHLDTCKTCGKTRLWTHRWDFDAKCDAPEVHWSTRWSKSQFGI
jgi:hypothetical protein